MKRSILGILLFIISITGVSAFIAPISLSANANGCTADDNTTYCLLAPLPGMGDETGKVDVQSGFGTYLNTIITLLFGLIGVLAVVMVTVGGIEYMSTVSMGEKEGAKSRITNAILGLLLALSSYLILKTINPALVDTDVSIETVTLDYKELPITSGDSFVPNQVPPTNMPPGMSQQLAAQILKNPKIKLQSDPKGDARSGPDQNILDVANGSKAWSSKRSDVGATQTTLNPNMLAGMQAASQAGGPIQVNEIVGGDHSSGSAHYSGNAFDVQASGSDKERNIAIMKACRDNGAREIIGPCSYYASKLCIETGFSTRSDHSTHIHCAW